MSADNRKPQDITNNTVKTQGLTGAKGASWLVLREQRRVFKENEVIT